ncbi:hypothetical protein [Streptomyces sp. NPDC020917]|uniref:hypothetical protein n=1 Tax=Streptomyces sp. NPDC020917 TaxID=3365102 RepID=UPI0037A47268
MSNEQRNTPTWAQQPQPQPQLAPQPAPHWGRQPTGPQWAPPQPPRKSKALKIILGAIGGIIAVSVIASLAGGGKNNTDDTADRASARTTTAPAKSEAPKATKAAAPAKASAAPKPKVVLAESGHGIKNTVRFTVHGDWDLRYTYNCSSFGYQGNFIVTGMGGDFPDVMVNEMGMKGSDVTHQHDGGTIYLQVDSECNWTVKATDLP